MRVLVFGISGFLGREVYTALRRKGHRITAAIRPNTNLPMEVDEVIRVDLGRATDMVTSTQQDAVIFLAQSRSYGISPSAMGGTDMARVNIGGLTLALEQAVRCKARRFLYASTGSVYKYSYSPLREEAPLGGVGIYALTKRLGEELVAAYSSTYETLCLRFFTLYGRGQKSRMIPSIVERVATGTPVFLEPREEDEMDCGGLKFSICYVNDAAQLVSEFLRSNVIGYVNVASPGDGNGKAGIGDGGNVARDRTSICTRSTAIGGFGRRFGANAQINNGAILVIRRRSTTCNRTTP